MRNDTRALSRGLGIRELLRLAGFRDEGSERLVFWPPHAFVGVEVIYGIILRWKHVLLGGTFESWVCFGGF